MVISQAGSDAAEVTAGEKLTAAMEGSTAQNALAADIHVTAEDIRTALNDVGKMDVSKVDALVAKQLATAEAAECKPCIFAARHGHWGKTVPDGWTHDKGSHVSFPGSGRWGACSGCGNIFSGLRTFDDHHSARECRHGVLSEGDTATWGTRDYVVKLHESGFLFWRGAVELDPSVFA